MNATRIVLVVVSAVVAAAPAAGCGRGTSHSAQNQEGALAEGRTHHSPRWGYSLSLPDGWRTAREPVSHIGEPREILSVGTFPLRHKPTDCDAFAGSARHDLGPRDAFLTVLERGHDDDSQWRDFPPRPAHFKRAVEAERAEPACGDQVGTSIYWRNFADAGRHFHLLVAIGRDARLDTRKEAWGIADSLRLDPEVRPDWPASG
jgi:hypothetical protein